ncbi:PepSY-associated TM helix domain-containing protein [Dechloromonas sp. A34]|uniref:PepSY-associated TM helix domain-containing protein n=1 Tax=Dechloromonas sp. A34 TaxID=447588 RepID=UPI0022495FCD|nr:PepSY-associated TM helix domain-containing protein [Dechloromonas sp. A34]
MKLNFKARSWHTWGSLILALPILIVGASAIFIAHKKALGTEEIPVAAKWLPGYRSMGDKAKGIEARAALTTSAGTTYVGSLQGLYRLDGDQLVEVEALANTQVRALAEAPFGRIAAAKSGIWLETNGQWQRTLKGDAWNASARPDGSVIVSLKDKGLMTSTDGRQWQPDALLAVALTSAASTQADKPLTLGKLIMDLHTGQAFFGKDGEWIWIDLVGLAMCLLALTGVYMWWRAEKRKAALTAG